MRNRAITFVADKAFLVPTLQAALQAARQPRVVELADILIVLTDVDAASMAELRAMLAATPLQLLVMDPNLFLLPDDLSFNKTHVPPSTLGRLYLDEILPPQYEHIIYMDGDIQIVGDLLPLVTYDVKPGHIGAAPEAAWLYKGEMGRYWPFMRSYLRGIGICDPMDYFNAGVLLFTRQTWREFAPLAKQFFFSNAGLCVYHDQSALNAVFLGRRELLSPRWNFVSGYSSNCTTDLGDIIIIHFTGGRKPWNYFGPPWYDQFSSSYAETLSRYPMLERLSGPMMPSGDQQRRRISLRTISRWLLTWRRFMRGRRIRRFMRRTNFALP